MTNPLDTKEIFDIALMNPNPTSSKTKDGPVYRVSFELEQEQWQWFMDADTKAMVLAAKCLVTDDGQMPEPEKKDKGQYGKMVQLLHHTGFFRAPKVAEAVGTDEEYQEWVRRQKCVISGQHDWEATLKKVDVFMRTFDA